MLHFFKGAKHQASATTVSQCQRILFGSRDVTTPLDQQVLKAEVLFTSLLVEHNLPFAVAQHATKIFEQMFPDSNIAKKYKCSYTKTAAIVEHALEPESSKAMFSCIKDQRQPFALMIDESNDILCDKECAMLVRFFSESSGKVCVGFLDMPVCNVGTGARIFECVNETLVEKHGLRWENVAAFASDNCNVMIGKRDSVLSRIKQRAPEIYSVGCPSHLVNICCKTAYKELDLNPESLVIDIYYYFDKSSKRRQDLKEFQEFCGVAKERVQKHCPTRWLSLGKSIKHLLSQWDAFQSYFNSKSENQKSRAIASRLNNPMMKVYAHFLSSVIPLFDRFNLVFQQKSSVLHRLPECVEELLHGIAVRLVQPQHIRQVSSIKDLDLCIDNQWDNVNLGIGREAKLLLMTDEVSELPERVVDKFYDDVRGYLTKSFVKVVEKFPLDCIVMENLKVLCPDQQDALTTNIAGSLAGRFP
ncbi:uncharacterized protein LOC117107512, partial [Anneissia japonica]|uniref:uncharacterized protein LOC117107512 n=1 Tax=Anneissia japonica TaxID=1529436 RepID=UPI00142570DB